MVNSKEIAAVIRRKTRTQKDIAAMLGISESYLALIKSGKRTLNPKNHRHQKISQKLKSLN